MNSSDSEPEDFCHCRTVNAECGDTACYCLAIKQLPCVPGMCDCDSTACKNVATSSQPPRTPSPIVSRDCHSTGVKDFCSSRSKEQLVSLLETVATKHPNVWAQISGKHPTPPQTQDRIPTWCKCGKCKSEEDPLDRICCKNHPKNHENFHFYHLCLDQQTLEIALINNCDWLNMPRVFNNSKFRNTAYRQYILWFHGKLGYRNRKRIPSCIKWAIRLHYPEPDGVYTGYHEAL